MKRWKKIVLGIVIALAIGIGGICIWQWNNIQTLFMALSQDPQEIANNVEDKRQEHQDAIEERVPVTIKPPTTEQSDQLLDQQATPDEIKDALGITDLLNKDKQHQQQQQEQPPSQDGASQPPDLSEPPPSKPPDPTEADLVNLCLAEMYACKIDLMGVLAQMKREAVAEWNSLPDSEHTQTRKMEIGLSGLAKCYELEGKVNDQVREILTRYRGRLSAVNGDLSIIDDLWQYYEEEKAAEKAYYLDKYMT